jgi:hypothetical protein
MKELDSLFETYKKSVLEKDIKTFASIFDENVRVFDMWGRWTKESHGKSFINILRDQWILKR